MKVRYQAKKDAIIFGVWCKENGGIIIIIIIIIALFEVKSFVM